MEGANLGTPGHSPALRFELELQEQEGGGAPSLSRVNKCFQVFDEVIPHLGVYQRVIQRIRQELHMAVYSDDWTSSVKTQLVSKPSDNTNLTPVPFFVIAQRLSEKKAGERNKFKAEISSLKEQLYTCEADLEKAISSLDTYRHDLKDRDAKIHHITSELRILCAEKDRLQEIISNNQHSKERLCQEFDYRMFALRTTIANMKEENGRLRGFKSTHDQLQENAHLLTCMKGRQCDTVVPATSTGEIEQHIIATEKLKLQLLTLQNSLMDELDSWFQTLYNKKCQVLPAEVIHKKKTFKSKISALCTELSLLDKHKETLYGRLQQLTGLKSTSSHTALVIPLHPRNPLVVQEQTLSKYAAMIYTSSDGENFCPLKVAQYCSSCAQETVVCPHKVCEDDLVIQIPVNCSHIKIGRPSLQLLMGKSQQVQPVPVPQQRDTTTTINQGLHIAVPDFRYLWTLIYKKFQDFEVTVPRKISQEQLVELVEQFYATLLLEDDKASLQVDESNDDKPTTLPESLFQFMYQHYIVRILAPVSCHAFVSSLQEFYPRNKELLLLSHVLCGDLDGCGIRYSLLQSDLVQAVTWTSFSQFSLFMSFLYPFLMEEEIEQLVLNYTAHSDNRLIAQLILEFLQFLLLAHKDPLILMLESKLVEEPCCVIGCMLETEFAEAMEKLVPTASDVLCHRLFLQSLLLFQDKNDSSRQTLPTKNLAYIAAYLHRLGTLNQLKLQLKKLRTIEATESRKQDSSDKMHSMETVRKLAEQLNTL